MIDKNLCYAISRARKNNNALKYVAWSFLGLTTLTRPGAYIGHYIGEQRYRANLELVHKNRLALSHIEAENSLKKNRLSGFLGQLTTPCADTTKQFLTGGPNQYIPTGMSQLLLQSTNLCPQKNITLIGEARTLESGYDQTANMVTHYKKSITAENNALDQSAATSSQDMLGGIVLQVAVEAGIVVVLLRNNMPRIGKALF